MSSVAPRPAHAGLDTKAKGGKLVFGKYKIHRRIGRGGMGEVYLASLVGELGFEKRLVIKTILPELAAKPKFVEMFAAEAKTAVSLSHGNIVPIYELGKADETLYIVMGHVDGPSVERMLGAYRKRGKPPELGLALMLAREVLTGLAYAHTSEPGRPAVVHRDISPRNVLVDRSGQVRIVDFGIAVPANVESAVRGGSTGYMAPEQARAELADPRADVFSAACLLYELVTLDKAFPKKDVWSTPDMSKLPEELSESLPRALSLEPLRRPADAGAFLASLGIAVARYAATLTDTALAAHLRELFPDGWDSEDKTPNPDELTPVTNIEPKTYATRLTEITGGAAPLKRPKAKAGEDAAGDKRRGTLWPAVALLALGGATVGLVATLPNGDQAVEAAAPRTRPGRVPASGASASGPVTSKTTEPLDTTQDDPPDPPDPLSSEEPEPEPATSESGAAPAPSAAWLTVEVEPTDAQVSVSGVPLRGPPFKIPIPEEGEATVRVAKAGFDAKEFQVRAGGSTQTQRIVLEKPQPRGKGVLQVFAPALSWAEVLVDGKKRGTTPMNKLELTAGTHRVLVRCVPDVCPSPRTLLEQTIKIEPDETTKLTAK